MLARASVNQSPGLWATTTITTGGMTAGIWIDGGPNG